MKAKIKVWWQNQVKNTRWNKVHKWSAIGYGLYFGTQIFDGFLTGNAGKASGYFIAILWFTLYCFLYISHKNITKALFDLIDQQDKLLDEIMKAASGVVKPKEKSPQGGIPSPFSIKRIF